MKKQKIKKPIIDWIQFDSELEWDMYLAFKENKIWQFPWLWELEGYNIINPRCESYKLFDWVKLWSKVLRAISYTPDFVISNSNWNVIVIEVKSKWTASKPDYRLRVKLFLLLYGNKLKFAELIQHNKKKYEFIKYY